MRVKNIFNIAGDNEKRVFATIVKCG